MKKWLSFLLVLAISISFAGCAKQAAPAETAQDGKTVVKVGIGNEFSPPFLLLDDQKQPIGYDMDYLNELQKKLPEYQFQYELGGDETQLIGTSTGKYAFAINFYFKNAERAQKFLYPENPYGYSATALVTKTDRNDIQSFGDLVGKKLTPMAASGGLRGIINHYNSTHPDKQVAIESIDNPSHAENLKTVANGKADASFLNAITFQEVNKNLKLDLKISGIVSKEPVYVVFNQSQTELAKKIDAATAEMTKDGTLTKLSEKWFNLDLFQDLDTVTKAYQNHQ
ncbi:amino acid ABC transporter substrate-binding protein, PAAT family [Syntrophobotulus glycolicus DSM 8271]|uniref:Amino acid ABC transporter substrate-binding protein, PAAT family n=1 Tax=Syntrophobotulus glycolicus (strain DSM 8271 / FlGlyR) TaxID=645991 RepID=F0SU49_SYNGF|nr:transporter substrate-binding domain-containing protein [Syntrophobotulus glycolicus]ADY55432.1 amino acid ABC transporter substrate-binding protein, PAAT family [Syntrophobotulus glycolicus DSM 8271]